MSDKIEFTLDGKKVTADLQKGRYVLICNVIGHYNSGQFAAFTVQ